MAIKVYALDALRTITKLRAYSGSLRDVRRVRVMESDTLRTVAEFAPAISLAVNPATSETEANSVFPVVITSDPVTATPTGGTGPYSYAWAQTSGPAATINNPANATSTFAMTRSPGSGGTAQFTCTVTDSIGQQAQAVATITFTNTSEA